MGRHSYMYTEPHIYAKVSRYVFVLSLVNCDHFANTIVFAFDFCSPNSTSKSHITHINRMNKNNLKTCFVSRHNIVTLSVVDQTNYYGHDKLTIIMYISLECNDVI